MKELIQKTPVLILAGGLGTRISEETHLRPKPMIEVGDIPILLHIMRYYYQFGFEDFVICGGYKVWEIQNYFLNYEFRQNHLEIDHRNDPTAPARAFGRDNRAGRQERWRVRVLDTGLECMTGARVKRALEVLAGSGQEFSNFALTYGDGVADVDLQKEFEFHLGHKKTGTILGARPVARFGELEISNGTHVTSFLEKPQFRQGLINGGFFFFKREFEKYLSGDTECILEKDPLPALAKDGGLMVFEHSGFWQPMDTLRDKNLLEDLWKSGKAPWIVKRAE